MSLLSVSAICDGKTVRLLESVSLKPSYRVVVTFIEPMPESSKRSSNLNRFWSSFGAWESDETAEETVSRIYEASH